MTSEKRGAGGDGEDGSPTHVGDGLDDADSAFPTPPGLETNIADRPEVKALLMEISKGLKEGEDPLYYDWTDQDQDAPTPESEAQVYVAGVALKPMRQKTMDLEKVRVAQHDPSRRAITARLPNRGSADTPPLPAQDRVALPPSNNLSMPVTISSCDRTPVPNHKEEVSPSPSRVPKSRLVYPATAAAAIFVSLGFLLLLAMRQASTTPTPTAAPRRTAAEVATTAGPSPSPPAPTASVMPQPDAALTATVPAPSVGPSAPSSKPGAAPEKPTPRPPPPGTTVPRWKKPSIKPAASSDAIERHPVF